MDIIVCARKIYTDYARQYGWLAGSRSDYIKSNGYSDSDQIDFIDCPFKNFEKFKKIHLKVITQFRPTYAVAPDIYSWDEFSWKIDYAYRIRDIGIPRVIVIPKVRDMIAKIPEDFIIGFPMGNKAYADVVLDEWELFKVQGRPIHLLGATPPRQAKMAMYHNVISVDGNAFIKAAHRFRKAYGENLESIDMRGNAKADEIVLKSIDGIAAFWKKFKNL